MLLPPPQTDADAASPLQETPLANSDGGVSPIMNISRDGSQGRAAEQAQQASEASLSVLLNAIQDSILLMEADGVVVAVNEIAAQRLGTTVTAMIGQDAYQFAPPEVQEQRRAYAQQVIRTGQPVQFLDQRRGRWIENAIYPVFNRDGQVIRLAIYGRDVTEQHQATELLRISEARYRLLAENVSDVIVIVDPQERVTYASPSAMQVLGYTEEELKATPLSSICSPDSYAAVIGAYASELAGGVDAMRSVHMLEVEVRRKDGVGVPLEVNLKFLRDDTGAPVSVIGIARDITERKNLDALLRNREREYRALVENSPDIVARFDRQLRHLYVNPAVELATGLPASAMIGKSDRDLGLPEAQVAFWEEHLNRVFATGQPDDIEFELMTPTGNQYYHSRLLPEFDAGGQIESVLGVTRNVTKRKQAELALRASEDRLRRIVETAQEGIWVIDADARTTFVNPTMAATLGYTVDEMMGAYLFDFLDEEGKRIANDNLERRRQGITEQHDFKFRRKDGSTMWAMLSTNPMIDEHGRYQGALAMVADISERKRMEDALTEREVLFRGVVATMAEGVALHGPSGQIVLTNPSAERILGLTFDQMIGRTAFDGRWRAMHEDGAPFPGELHPAMIALRTGKPQRNVVMGVHKPDGDLTWISINALPLMDRDQPQPYAVVATFHDISERKQAEARLFQAMNELERSNQDLEQFAYVVSHDLQEPLRMVASFVQLLAKDYRGRLDADADEYIGYAVDGARRMQQITADLLTYARVSTRGNAFAPVDCTGLVHEVLSSLQFTIEEAEAVVTCAPLPLVMGDDTQIYQIFQNLIANALKYRSSAPPCIAIGVDPAPDAEMAGHLRRFWVRDNGIGIDPQDGERVFVIFQRLHARTEYPGTGIGLAICKKIVERHGGRIWVESNPGEGATFYFTLPVANPSGCAGEGVIRRG